MLERILASDIKSNLLIIWNTDILEKRSSKTEGKKSQNLAATAFHTILNLFPFSVPNLELKEYDPVLEL